MANPFQFGRAVEGDQFTDREEPLRLVTTCMREGQNAILVSPRRYGKTSLLKTAVRSINDSGGHAAMVDLMLCADRRAVADEVRKALLPLSRGWLANRVAQWRELVASRIPHLAITLEHGGYETTFRPVARDYDWRDAMVRFLTQRAAGAGKPMSDGVAESLFDVAHGVPNTVQLFAFWAYQEADRRIDDQAVARGIALAVDAVAPELAVTFSELSSVQQRIVLVLARECAIAHPYEASSLAASGGEQTGT